MSVIIDQKKCSIEEIAGVLTALDANGVVEHDETTVVISNDLDTDEVRSLKSALRQLFGIMRGN